jgi:hypothetical protein
MTAIFFFTGGRASGATSRSAQVTPSRAYVVKMHDIESDQRGEATPRELEVTWTHHRARKSVSGGFVFRYRR